MTINLPYIHVMIIIHSSTSKECKYPLMHTTIDIKLHTHMIALILIVSFIKSCSENIGLDTINFFSSKLFFVNIIT